MRFSFGATFIKFLWHVPTSPNSHVVAACLRARAGTIRAIAICGGIDHVSHMKSNSVIDVLVAGNGPAGCCAALAFAQAGFSVALAGPERQSKDMRTTALMMPAVHFLDRLGVWQGIEPDAAPLQAMRIIDGTNRLLRARPVTFQAGEIGEAAFGWNVPNDKLLAALQEKLNGTKQIQQVASAVSSYDVREDRVLCALENGRHLLAKLVAGADGRSSKAREAAGIDVRTWRYPQTAMVLAFGHQRGHANISTEFHTETGPFTQVPLPGNRSSLVWVMNPASADEFEALSQAELSLRIERKMESMLGKIKVDAPRQFYPLSGQTPASFAARRVMLAGEAAHVFPPIGAQGLNLGLRDVEEAVLAAAKSPDDPGSDAALSAFNSARRSDILLRTGAVDMLNRSLLSDFLPVQLARGIGLGILAAIPPLRGLLMREGMRPGSGLRGLFRQPGNRSAGR
jgi:2-octaprenyl-6-methoxyphenol hydroxylase